MTGGLLQLAALGNENIYLNGNPQITYFKMVYKRYTNYADESISITPVGSNELEYDEEKTMKFKIDRHGDLVGNVYLCVTMPDIYSYYKTSTNVYIMKWIKHLGFHMIKSVTLYVGGQKVDSQSGEWLLIWNELFADKDTKNHLFKMIGHTQDMYKPYAESTSKYPLSDAGTVNTNEKIKHHQLSEENYIYL